VTTKNKFGFSLLELMVVVAIIGVLATFAVPRFNIFRARARQGEAKSNLGVIFTLQEAFKIDKESYYNGDNAHWGGNAMNGYTNRDGYHGAGASSCESNKLGFRLANCDAARYAYYIQNANEDMFMVHAVALSDSQKRIFPGCNGSTRENTSGPAGSKTGKTKCTGLDTSTNAGGSGGDAFCLDHLRSVDNFVDIVGSQTCSD